MLAMPVQRLPGMLPCIERRGVGRSSYKLAGIAQLHRWMRSDDALCVG